MGDIDPFLEYVRMLQEEDVDVKEAVRIALTLEMDGEVENG